MKIFGGSFGGSDFLTALCGSGDEDIVVASNVAWGGVKEYRDLTVNAGKTVSAMNTLYGPLIIRCSGKLTVNGTIRAYANAWRWEPGMGDWLDNAGEFMSGWEATAGWLGYGSSHGSHWRPWGSLPFCIPGGSGGGAGGGSGFAGGDAGIGDAPNAFPVRNPMMSELGALPGGPADATGADGQSALDSGYWMSGLLPQDVVDLFFGTYRFAVGGGGGYGGDDGGFMGFGPGGAGGGVLIVCAREVEVAEGGSIHANGADGGSPASGDTGGGGGGGGGTVYIVTGNYTNNGTVEAAGGAGGTGAGSGGDGGPGDPGVVRVYVAGS